MSSDVGRVCECCMSDNQESLLELSRVHKIKGGYEVYRKMLLECFSISVPSYSHGGMICTECAVRLRDAFLFRGQILNAQKTLREKATWRDHGLPETSSKQVDNIDDTKQDSDAESIQEMPLLCEVVINTDGDTEKNIKKRRTSTDPARFKDREAILNNVSTILSSSNVTPFRGQYVNGYRCYYCDQCHKLPDQLRTHTIDSHSAERKSGLVKLPKAFNVSDFFIYLDIKGLKCELCNKSVDSLTDLKSHLAGEHKKRFLKENGDRCIPFELEENLSCRCCTEKFTSFRALVFHMNTHYPNSKCSICHEGFITAKRLKNHREIHSEDQLQCTQCPKKFKSNTKLHMHKAAVHKITSRFRCPHCSEKFYTYPARTQHLVEKHGGESPEYECKLCSKKFVKASMYSTHMRKVHWNERNFVCSVCGLRFFLQFDLSNHMVMHSKPESHTCEVCKKVYSRVKSLMEHKRLYHNDRCVCLVCGSSFAQNVGLKRHMASKHPDVCEDGIDVK